MVKITALALFLSPLSFAADLSDCSQIPRTPFRVYFGNGMQTTRAAAQDALDDGQGGGLRPLVLSALPPPFDSSQLSFCLSYDSQYTDSTTLKLDNVELQLLDAAEQKGLEMSPLILSWLWNFQNAPPFGQSLLTNALNKANYVFRPEVQQHVAEYSAQLGVGKAIVVAHSQGNFYANEAYDLISPAPQGFSAIAVASPANHVAGFPPGRGPWTTLHYDVITLVSLFTLGNALPADWDNSPACSLLNSIACHDFVNSYLYGGHESYQDPGNTSGPRIVGQVIAAIQGSVPSPSTYTISDLGTLPSGDSSCGLAINASGAVAGWASTSGSSAYHAFLYTPGTGGAGTIKDLKTLGAFPNSSVATGINASGQVTGYSSSFASAHAFLYSGGVMVDIQTLAGGTYSYGQGINDAGQIVGFGDRLGGGSPHVFVYDSTSNTFADLPPMLGYRANYGLGINSTKQVTGYMTASDGTQHAFLYTPQIGFTDVQPPSGFTYGQGLAINESGQLTGVTLTSTGAAHAFRYTSAAADIGTLQGELSSQGLGISGGGQVVGSAGTPTGDHAFLYTPGKSLVDLNTLIPTTSGWTLTAAYGINDAGQITGCGRNGTSTTRAFVLTPVR